MNSTFCRAYRNVRMIHLVFGVLVGAYSAVAIGENDNRQFQANKDAEKTAMDSAASEKVGDTQATRSVGAAATPWITVEGAPVLTADLQSAGSLINVPASSFRSDGNGGTFFAFEDLSFRGDGGSGGCIMAPVHFPGGVNVTGMYLSYYDNSDSVNLSVNLRRSGYLHSLGELAQEMATLSSTGKVASIQVVGTSVISLPTINNLDYTYNLTACLLSADVRLYSVRFYFEANN